MKPNEQIKRARLSSGISQEKLGDLTGLGRLRILQLESEKSNPTVKTLRIIGDALNCVFEV